jgi:predicted permease
LRGVITGFAAIWAVTAVGWLVGRLDLLGARAERVLARLVFFVLTPALLFTTLSRSDPADLVTPALVAFAASAAVTAAAGAALARVRGRQPVAETVVAGLCSSYVNAANLGIPVAAYVLDDVSAVAPVLLFQVLFVAPMALAVLDSRDGPARSPRRLVMVPARNPVFLGSAAGIAVALVGWRPPEAAVRPVELLGSATVPVALLALGLALAGARPLRRAREQVAPEGERVASDPAPAEPDGGGRGLRYGLVALKTVVQPLVAYLVARHALGLAGPALLAAVVMAALPTAQNVFVFASRYERAEHLARDVVLLSTVVTAATMAVVAAWLG